MPITDQLLNRLKVLKAIRRHGPISRIELPSITNLSLATITQATSDLVQLDLLIENKQKGGQSGRPRSLLEINANALIVIGASIETPSALKTAFVDLSGNKLFEIEIVFDPATSLNELANRISDALSEAIATSPFGRDDICRIGLALPATVDSVRGVVHYMATLPSDPVPFAEILEADLGIAVTIENDMICMARAEHWFGRAQGMDAFTMIHVGYGISSAEYADGIPKPGNNGLNPEFGHVKTDLGQAARPCFCGAKGCLIAYSSIYGIVTHEAPTFNLQNFGFASLDANFETVLDRAEQLDERAIHALNLAAKHIAAAIGNIVNTIDPGHILILVSNLRFLELIAPTVEEEIKSSAWPATLLRTTIKFDVADDLWRWRGAAALALEQTYLTSKA